MAKKTLPKWATTVTPFSKYLALILFILLPFIGFYLGMQYQQQSGRSRHADITVSPTQIPFPSSPHAPNLLIVTRAPDKIDNLPLLMQAITDGKKVKQLYDEINALPTFLPSGGVTSCPIDFFASYTLDFYSGGDLLLHGVLDPTGCRTIGLGGGKAKWAIGVNGGKFINDLQQSLMLSKLDFYGSQNGRPNMR